MHADYWTDVREKKSNERVTKLFFLKPRKVRHLRELSRECGLPASTVSSAVDEL